MNYHTRIETVNLEECTLQNTLGLTADQLKTIRFGSASFHNTNTRRWPTGLAAEMNRLRARLKKRKQRGGETNDIEQAISALAERAQSEWVSAHQLAEQYRRAVKHWRKSVPHWQSLSRDELRSVATSIWAECSEQNATWRSQRKKYRQSLPTYKKRSKRSTDLLGFVSTEIVRPLSSGADISQLDNCDSYEIHVQARKFDDDTARREALANGRDFEPAAENSAHIRADITQRVHAAWKAYLPFWKTVGPDLNETAYVLVKQELAEYSARRIDRCHSLRRLRLETNVKNPSRHKTSKRKPATARRVKPKRITVAETRTVMSTAEAVAKSHRDNQDRIKREDREAREWAKWRDDAKRRKRIARRYMRKAWRAQLRRYSKFGVRGSTRTYRVFRIAQRHRRLSILRGDLSKGWHHRVI